jgi:hypothetical protein
MPKAVAWGDWIFHIRNDFVILQGDRELAPQKE